MPDTEASHTRAPASSLKQGNGDVSCPSDPSFPGSLAKEAAPQFYHGSKTHLSIQKKKKKSINQSVGLLSFYSLPGCPSRDLRHRLFQAPTRAKGELTELLPSPSYLQQPEDSRSPGGCR